ncbi:hypothetical protein GX50_08145 [[Emmonsia] crescens]|uniref:Uncharacterized protein n=1 Tax=[Emmonsia] crescens TaxID=73230 RepID=A0A2B7Z5D7_9EURO|nr:hypothetical protein GX50_08145 [Emmonsia crescens]
MSKTENNPPVTQTVDDDEPDDWLGNEVSGLAGGLTLFGAGTSESSAPDAQDGKGDSNDKPLGIIAEQLKMNDCYYEKRDWRECKKEVSQSLSSV